MNNTMNGFFYEKTDKNLKTISQHMTEEEIFKRVGLSIGYIKELIKKIFLIQEKKGTQGVHEIKEIEQQINKTIQRIKHKTQKDILENFRTQEKTKFLEEIEKKITGIAKDIAVKIQNRDEKDNTQAKEIGKEIKKIEEILIFLNKNEQEKRKEKITGYKKYLQIEN